VKFTRIHHLLCSPRGSGCFSLRRNCHAAGESTRRRKSKLWATAPRRQIRRNSARTWLKPLPPIKRKSKPWLTNKLPARKSNPPLSVSSDVKIGRGIFHNSDWLAQAVQPDVDLARSTSGLPRTDSLCLPAKKFLRADVPSGEGFRLDEERNLEWLQVLFGFEFRSLEESWARSTRNQSSTLARAQGVFRKKVRLDLTVGSKRKQRIGMRRPISFQPCRSTNVLMIVSRVTPCSGSRGCSR
jgi:hypothetical protein